MKRKRQIQSEDAISDLKKETQRGKVALLD